MKTVEDIKMAKHIICGNLMKRISEEQRITLQAYLVALNWVIDNPNGSSLKRLVSGEPIIEKGE